jgi:hypothetical protein
MAHNNTSYYTHTHYHFTLNQNHTTLIVNARKTLDVSLPDPSRLRKKHNCPYVLRYHKTHHNNYHIASLNYHNATLCRRVRPAHLCVTITILSFFPFTFVIL